VSSGLVFMNLELPRVQLAWNGEDVNPSNPMSMPEPANKRSETRSTFSCA
jgi:hypothetical protein